MAQETLTPRETVDSLVARKKAQWAKEKEELYELWGPIRRNQESRDHHFEESAAKFGGPNYEIRTHNRPTCQLPPIVSSNKLLQDLGVYVKTDKSGHHGILKNSESTSRREDGYDLDSQCREGACLPLCINTVTGEVHVAKGGCKPRIASSNRKNLQNSANNKFLSIHPASKSLYEEDASTSGYQSENNSRQLRASVDAGSRVTSGESSNLKCQSKVIIHKIHQETVENHSKRTTGIRTEFPEKENVNSNRDNQEMSANAEDLNSSAVFVTNVAKVQYDRNMAQDYHHRNNPQNNDYEISARSDKDRSRWGDKGVGVGKFWQPSDAPEARLPNMEKRPTSPHTNRGDLDTPAWLEKRMSSAVSYSIVDKEPSYNRAKTMPLEDEEEIEKERRRRMAKEQQEALRKQIEERQERLKREKEERIKQEKVEEARFIRQKQLELERLEKEKRQTSRSLENIDSIQDERAMYKKSLKEQQVFVLEPVETIEGSDEVRNGIDVLNDADVTIQDLELARRQSVVLLTQQEQDKMHSLRTSKSCHDVSLMTDNDHEFKRVVTPTKERRLRDSSRECSTQTDSSTPPPTPTSNKEKDQERQKVAKDSSSGSDKKGKRHEDCYQKPRWGATAPKKKYVKQSEKDPQFQKRTKRRVSRSRKGGSEKVVNDVKSEAIETSTESEGINPTKEIMSSSPPSQPQKLSSGFQGSKNKKSTPTAIKNNEVSKENNEMARKDKAKQEVAKPLEEVQKHDHLNHMDRPESPPVPAVLKKIQMGVHFDPYANSEDDENKHDKFNNVKAEKAEFEPENPLKTEVSWNPDLLEQNVSSDLDESEVESKSPPPSARLSRTSSAGKLDIEVEVRKMPQSHSLNVITETDYLRDYVCSSQSTAQSDDGDGEESTSSRSRYIDLDPYYFQGPPPPNFNSTYGDRPSTRESDISQQEAFIRELMEDGMIQNEISSREAELSESGIIEFDVRIPNYRQKSDSYDNVFSHYYSGYIDPLHENQRRQQRVSWLRRKSYEDANTSLLAHIAYLRKGIKEQQLKWGFETAEKENE